MRVWISVDTWPPHSKLREERLRTFKSSPNEPATLGKIVSWNIKGTRSGEVDYREVWIQPRKESEGLAVQHEGDEMQCLFFGALGQLGKLTGVTGIEDNHGLCP